MQRRAWHTAALIGLVTLVTATGDGRRAGAAGRLRPQIVNGIVTSEYPTVGLLLDATNGLGICSGTLIGCRTFLTAAHCVCPEDADNAVACGAQGVSDPQALLVFFQHAGPVGVTSVAVSPNYQFATGGDVAILKLAAAVTGVTPSPLRTGTQPAFGTRGLIAGFGRTGGNPDADSDAGIKRAGAVTIQACREVPEAAHVCWGFEEPLGPPGEDSNTCQGDSGGPLFVLADGDGPLTLAGVTSGGDPASCLAVPDGESWDTDVTTEQAFIQTAGGDDVGASVCGDLPPIGTPGAAVTVYGGTLGPGDPTVEFALDVPPGTHRLRVALNGRLFGSEAPNDFDLFVNPGSPAEPATAACADTNELALGYCEFENPEPGTWYALVTDAAGAGEYQVTVTTLGVPCTGDCDGDGDVTVDELVTMVNISLGTVSLDACPAGDPDGDGDITIDELVTAVNVSLTGCSA